MSNLSRQGAGFNPSYSGAFVKFQQNPTCGKIRGAGAATGAGGDVNVMVVPGIGDRGPTSLEYTMKGTQTLLAPIQDDVGLNIGLDQTDNDGVEIDFGILSSNPCHITVGTDQGFVRLKLKVAVVAGVDPLYVGWRKVAARQGDYNDYTDFAVVGYVADGSIKVETALNNAATSTTDTTLDGVNATVQEFIVAVNTSGVASFFVDGTEVGPTTDFTFDTGDVLMPFIFMLQANASQSGAVDLIELEVNF